MLLHDELNRKAVVHRSARAADEQHGARAGHRPHERLGDGKDLLCQLPSRRHDHRADLCERCLAEQHRESAPTVAMLQRSALCWGRRCLLPRDPGVRNCSNEHAC